MADLALHNPQRTIPESEDTDALDDQDVLNVLDSYRVEGEQGRSSGPAPRNDVWESNWKRYWGHYDMSDKQSWQARYVMPEAPQYIDRWAAAMREALDTGGEWFVVEDEIGTYGDLVPHVTKLMKILLGRCSFTADGHVTDFSSVFEDQMKLGALMQLCASVTWRTDGDNGGWVSVESVDPREVWQDPKMRNLYRRRRYNIDKHELLALAKQTDDNGDSLYDVEAIAELHSKVSENADEKETSSGHGDGGDGTSREQIEIEEWLATVVSKDGDVVHSKALIIVANRKYIIRKPEENPFWHKQDWIVSCPLIPVPFSAYGRTYMEDWADVADAFVEMTQLILDGVFTSTLKAFAAVRSRLKNPGQLDEGISPNMIFELNDEGDDPKTFIREIDLGTLPAESINVWQALKQELRDGAKLSEIALGQMAPKQGTTATEINEVSQSGSAMVRSMARTVESRFVEPILTMVWQTALQHMDFTTLKGQMSDEAINMLQTRKEEFRDLKIKFRVRGISGVVDRQAQLRNMLALLQLIAQNEAMMQVVMQDTSISKIVMKLFSLFGVDMNELKLTPQEQAINAASAPQAPQAPVAGAPAQ